MARAKGSPKPPGSGRKAGTPNKTTTAFKTAVLEVFHRMGEVRAKNGEVDEARSVTGADALLAWALSNPTDFYKIAARLIPHEVIGPGDKGEHLVKTIQHVHETVPPVTG